MLPHYLRGQACPWMFRPSLPSGITLVYHPCYRLCRPPQGHSAERKDYVNEKIPMTPIRNKTRDLKQQHHRVPRVSKCQ